MSCSTSKLPPNTRVQRTRPSPSALRSPLTRHPLGGRSYGESRELAGTNPQSS
jgi:hypothetical protein